MNEVLKVKVHRYVAACALALAAMVMVPAAQAASVSPDSGVLSGNGEEIWSFNTLSVSSNGKLTVEVHDLAIAGSVMSRLESLSFSINAGSQQLGAMSGEGALTVDVWNLGSVTLNIFAIPSGDLHFGALSWKATLDSVAPVPLPASFWLLVVGAALAIGLQRKRAKLAVSGSNGLFAWRAGPALAH